MFETPQQQAPRLQSPPTDPLATFAEMTEYELRMEINLVEQWYRNGNAVNTLKLANELPGQNFRRYILLCRALRAKTRPLENWPHRGKHHVHG